jgi:hypothetical protein
MLEINKMAVFREEFDDNSLLFNPISGKAFYLNYVATFIWKQLCLGHSLEEIKTETKFEFSNIPLDMNSDVDDFLKSLIQNGFVGTEI